MKAVCIFFSLQIKFKPSNFEQIRTNLFNVLTFLATKPQKKRMNCMSLETLRMRGMIILRAWEVSSMEDGGCFHVNNLQFFRHVHIFGMIFLSVFYAA